MRRGEVRWCNLEPPYDRRPVLILTRTVAIRYLNEVTVVPITSTVRSIPTEVLLDEEDGMSRLCAANCDHIQTVPKEDIDILITVLSEERMAEIGPAIQFALDLKLQR